jgi:uncharacterized protein
MTGALGGLTALGLGTLAYSWLYETRAYTLRRAEAPVLSPGTPPMTLLHLSDLHMLPADRSKAEWLSGLARIAPDLVVLTGDVISSDDAGETVLDALRPLLDFPGAFVPGNNDYYAPQVKNPVRYFTGSDPVRYKRPLDWCGFAARLADTGWHDLTNVRARLRIGGRDVDIRGVDDPYTRRDRLAKVAGRAAPDAALRLGIAHAPEPRVLDAYAADGVDLLLAGHTHGGQVRVPGIGALVTNCGLDRTRARGLSRWGTRGRTAWLHVSAGLGTSPYAPVRFACRPEATLLRLVPDPSATRSSQRADPAVR